MCIKGAYRQQCFQEELYVLLLYLESCKSLIKSVLNSCNKIHVNAPKAYLA